LNLDKKGKRIMNFSVTKVRLAITGLAIPLLALAILFPGPARVIGALPDASTDYKAKCASCHGLDGSGNTPLGKKLQLKDLRSPEVQKMTDAQMNALITKGKGKMPGNAGFNPDQVKQLVAYVRELAKKK
jgi:mono/diheme cytochrome c family protein